MAPVGHFGTPLFLAISDAKKWVKRLSQVIRWIVVMRQINWLHISDIHMRPRDSWSQDVVLRAMSDHIERQRSDGVSADFILATGDLAFSGKADEYILAGRFFDELSAASGVPKERIFCIPGNHDIDRDRQRLCFLGARNSLQDQNQVDLILAPGEDVEALLKRQENYREFQRSYFIGQDRTWTADGLGYVSCLTIADVRLAILGLDSGWLAEGGVSDHGKLLIGERQVINAIRIAQEFADPPHIIVGMAHHPFHLLQDFDRRPVQNRIERACQFFHCGHLHEPEARTAGHGDGGCLLLSAGASYESRQTHNTYSLITLDLMRARRTVKTVRYDPGIGTFSYVSSGEYRIDVSPSGACGVGELAQAIKTYCSTISPWAHYLSALLLDQKSEIPIPARDGHTFGSPSVLEAQPDSDLKRMTTDFMAFRNILYLLYKRLPLIDILNRHGQAIGHYGAALTKLCEKEAMLKEQLSERDNDAQKLAGAPPQKSSSYTGALLAELATEQDWDALCEQAQRHLDSPDRDSAIQAKRMLALGRAHSEEAADRAVAAELYRVLISEGRSEATDVGNLALLLIDSRDMKEAKDVVLAGVYRFSANRSDYFLQIGQKIVQATGDRSYRKQLEAAIEERGKRD